MTKYLIAIALVFLFSIQITMYERIRNIEKKLEVVCSLFDKPEVKYEYKYYTLIEGSELDFLNNLAQNGGELVTIVRVYNKTYYYVKTPLK